MLSTLSKTELIAELEKTQAQLAAAEQSLHTFFDAIDDLLFMLDGQGNIIFTNKKATSRLGYTSTELVGQSVLAVHPPERRAEAGQIVAAMLAGMADACPVPLVTKDGRQIPVETRVVQSVWHGQPVIFGVTKDLSELKAAEDKFTKAFHASPAPMAITDGRTGEYLDVNERFLETLGYERAEVVGKTATELALFADADQRVVLLTRMKEQGWLRNEDVLVRAKAGNLRNGVFSAEFLQLRDQTLLLTVMDDITEQKQAAATLRQSEQLLHESQAIANLGSWTADLNTGSFTVTAEAASILGLAPGVHTEAEFQALLHPEDQAFVQSAWSAARCDTPYDVEYRIVVGGAVRWLHVRARFTGDESGNPATAVGITQDITARKQAEAELRLLERRSQALVENAPDAIILVGPDGNFKYASPTIARKYGFSPDEFLGRDPVELTHPADRDRVLARLTELLQDPMQVPTLQYRFQHKDGSWRWVESTFSNLLALPSVEAIVINSHDITERKLAEEQLHTSQVRLELAVRGANAGFWDWIIPTAELIINQRWATMLGYTLAELEPVTIHTWERLCHPADLVDNQRQLTEHFAHARDFYEIETRMRHKTGEWVWVLTSGQVTEWDADGNPLRMNGTHIDITARKRAEAALRASEERYRGLLHSLDSLVATVDAGGALHYMNDVAAAQLRREPGALTVASIFDLLPQPAAARQWAAICQVFQDDKAQVGEGLSLFRGQPRWSRISLQPIHDEQGRVDQVLLNATDIHELKSAQEALLELNHTLETRVQERTAELQDLYDNAPAGYHSVDADCSVIRINQTELNWLGYARDEVLGRSLCDLLTPASLPILQNSLPVLREQGWLRESELEFVRKDGTTFPVQLTAVAFYSAENEYIMARMTMQDITERRVANEALRHANQEMARALRLKDEFLANMSHELRTPLTGVLALSEVLTQGIYGQLNDRQQKAVQNIEASGRHLLALINDLLDLAKIEAGKFELNLGAARVDEICQACLLFVRALAAKKHIQLTYACSVPNAMLWADPIRLKQMLVNLLSNAIKFTPENGCVQLRVEVQPGAQQIQFAVQDTGIGIAAGDLARLFQPFTQLDATLARQYEGTGLGLALVKRLAEQHGGGVHVESAGVPGLGSRFTVTLPCNLPAHSLGATPPGAGADEPSAAYPVVGAGSAAGERILLVEDNEMSIEVLQSFLAHLGYRPLIARTGLEALTCAQTHPPALILMDIQLPVMDGLEVTSRLRSNPQFATTPIIALTALAMPGDRERCLAAGATDYLSKPLRLPELAALMTRLLPARADRP